MSTAPVWPHGVLALVVVLAASAPAAAQSIVRGTVVDAQGRLVRAYSGSDWSPAQLVADLKAASAPVR